MRQYEPVWIALKNSPNLTVSLTANRLLHARIIKAVKKEKWKDLGFKLENAPREALLTHRVHSGTIIEFTLTLRLLTVGESDI